MSTAIVTVRVTGEDFGNASGHPGLNPVVVALRRTLALDKPGDVAEVRRRKNGTPYVVVEFDGVKTGPTVGGLAAFMDRFDAGEPARPFWFKLPLPMGVFNAVVRRGVKAADLVGLL